MNSKELELVDEQLNCTCIYNITGLDITNTAICFQFLIHACVVLAIMCIDKILCFRHLLIDRQSNLQLTFGIGFIFKKFTKALFNLNEML